MVPETSTLPSTDRISGLAEAPDRSWAAEIKARFGLNHRSVQHSFIVVPQGDRIPKILHQTYHTKFLPEAFLRNQEQLQRNNPNWEYRLYDDDDIETFIGDAYGPTILSYYKRINPKYGAARADLFRYLLMYKEGGAYLDIKSTLAQPIDTILRPDDQYWLSTWRNGPGEPHEGYGIWKDLRDLPQGEFQQWHIVTVAGHPFLRAVIDAVLMNIDRYHPCLHGVGRSGVIRVTGPVAYTRAIYPLLGQYRHRRVHGEVELGLAYSVLSKLAHTSFFKAHYLQLTEPVVDIGGVGGVIASLYTLGLDANILARRLARVVLPGPPTGMLSKQ